MASNVESKQIRKSSRETAGKTLQNLDFVYTKDRTCLSNNKADSDSSTSTNTSAYKTRNNLLTTVTTTASTVTLSLNSPVSTTNTVQTLCNTTPIITKTQNKSDDNAIMNFLAKLDKKLDDNTSTLNTMKDDLQSMAYQLSTKADIKSVEKLEEKVNTLESELNNLKTELNSKDYSKIAHPDNRNQDTAILPELVKQEMMEQSLIKSKQNNIILKNLPEQNNSETDTELCQELLQTICPLENNNTYQLRRSFRLGKPTAGKNRFYKVIFDNPQHRRNILAKATSLKNLPTTNKFSKVIVSSDLTPTQLLKSKNLKLERDQAIQRDANTHWVIYRGKVMADTERDRLKNLPLHQ